jgi:hypothetical protein
MARKPNPRVLTRWLDDVDGCVRLGAAEQRMGRLEVSQD